MADLIAQPVGAHSERSGVANPPSYHDATIFSALPATNEEWTGLLKNNTSCLKGIVVSRQAGIPEIAQYTAFEFNYDPNQGPEHVQDENTEFKVVRIESESQQHAVDIGISQHEFELLMKTVATDMGLAFQTRQTSLHQHKQSSNTRKLLVSHRHPKFILFLDQRSLMITEACRARLVQLKNSNDRKLAVAFLEDYGKQKIELILEFESLTFQGEVFAMQATFGGRLFHSENVSKLEGDALDQRQNTLEIAAKASFSSIDSFSKTASVGSNTDTLHTTHSKATRTTEGMFWCGVGGDPCLHRHPEAWIISMKDKSRWKIIDKKVLVSLPVALGKFSGFEWVPDKFSQLLRPMIPVLPRLVLSKDSQIGLSSIAIAAIQPGNEQESDSELCASDENQERFFVVFQDHAGCIKYGYIDMNDDHRGDILFVDTIARARHNTPLFLSSRFLSSASSIIYVTEDGYLADQNLDTDTGAWDCGSLVDLKLQVAPYSNLAASTGPEFYLCFEGPDGKLCVVGPGPVVENMDHGEDLNILPGTSLTIKNWWSYSGSIGWRSTHHNLAIGFQNRDGKLMSLEREKDEKGDTHWNLSEIVAPSITESISFEPFTRANFLFSLYPGSPPTIDYIFLPDSSGRIVWHNCEESGDLVRRSNPACTIWGSSRYAYADGALVYMSSDGRLECTLPSISKTREIFQPHCRKRCHAQRRKTFFP